MRFEARDPEGPVIACFVTGGNLVAESGNPIAPSTNTQVTIAQSSSPTIATPDSDTNLLYLVESLIASNKGIGQYFYWDPTNGNDTNNGTTPSTAVKTFNAAKDLATAGNNDVIFCLATDPAGITTVTNQTLAIDVPTLKVRGPGYPFQIIPGTQASATVVISAASVECSGFYIETDAGGTYNGITVTGNNVTIKDCWIDNATGNGIDISSASRTKIQTCAVENCGGDGVKIGNSTTKSLISKSILFNCSNGASLSGTGTISDNIFEDNLIYKNSTYGINIGADVIRTGVRSGNSFAVNGSGSAANINEDPSAVDSFIETIASAETVADAVWDELITGHLAANTTGKTLKDAKTKATLASLK